MLQRLSASNEGILRLPDKLALLERRLTVPASPVVSRDNGGSLLINQNSVHSVTQPSGLQQAAGAGQQQHEQRDATPSISNTQLLQQQAGRSMDGLEEANSGQPSKRRRVAAGGEAGRGGSKAGASPLGGGAPSQQRPSLSPFLTESGAAKQQQQQQQPTPTSSKKQKNTISRYFPQISGGGGAVAAGGDLAATAAKRPGGVSPAQSDQQAAAPAAAVFVQTLQLEAQRLR